MIVLNDTGTIEIHAFASYARLPLEDVAITVTAYDGTAIAMRLTDRNGLIRPIVVPVPSPAAGQTPDTGVQPYTPVNLWAGLAGYEQIEIQDLQVFPGITTNQNLAMIPLAELPADFGKQAYFPTPGQDL